MLKFKIVKFPTLSASHSLNTGVILKAIYFFFSPLVQILKSHNDPRRNKKTKTKKN